MSFFSRELKAKCGLGEAEHDHGECHGHSGMIGWKWSVKEKLAARTALNLALDRELAAVIHEAKERAERIKEASDLWEMETWLIDQREGIARTFDFRYSVLARVFATLLRERRVSLIDLRGLAQEKLDTIERLSRT
ncbi:hypothetical protein HDF16_006305 [Granulicella aggregans]|uniref:Uncharacterized protein n=1 Tax=Granulicella aggregans TaxID=474949 RepID=A0A7W7ZKE7_9BACT|nr:hypothetical protein [Granulicella aggregans]MBB5061569.1 hypothetical protein [Granulicella aggregans]